MEQHSDTYQLPTNTSGEIRKMCIWMAAAFGVLVAIGIAIIIFAQTLVKFVPFSAEERFIKPYEGILVEDLIRETEDSQILQTYLESLVTKLQKADILSGKVTFKIHYSDKRIKNAYATVGGHVVIYRGLLNEIESENGLAMVVAHEMAHIENRDAAASMGRSLALSLIISSASGGYSDDIAEVLSQAGINQFSLKQERSADLLALDLINTHYGHVGGRDEFFSKMKEDTVDVPEWLSSHPDLAQRISYLQKQSTDKGYLVGEKIPFPDEVQEILRKERF